MYCLGLRELLRDGGTYSETAGCPDDYVGRHGGSLEDVENW